MEIVSSDRTRGYVMLVLHAHLPFVRFPENENHLEEYWLFEAMTETYIPLLRIFETLLDEGIDFRITLSLTPTLTAMLGDELLKERFRGYLQSRIELSEREIVRTGSDRRLRPLAKMYRERFRETLEIFDNRYGRDLISAFRRLNRSGKVELLTSAATHAYLPALMARPQTVRSQIELGVASFRTKFGAKPKGIWLPECGFTQGIDRILKDAGLNFFFLEEHGAGDAERSCGICAPVRTPEGPAAFPRDAESSRQIWSSIGGYPGDPDYRDFYRDIGFDLDEEHLRDCLPGGTRTFTGLKYYRISGKSEIKKPYSVGKALIKARLHAGHFVQSRQRQILLLSKRPGGKPLITSAFDAELFGHWWFEGPLWLDFFFRRASRQKTFRLVTPSEYLEENGRLETSSPRPSSWGEKGYGSTWINPSNAWIYRHLHRASRVMTELADANPRAKGLRARALNQAGRELLLAQASDWAFMMKTGNAAGFGEERFREHMGNFLLLQDGLLGAGPDPDILTAMERKNNIFPFMDYRMFCSHS